MPKQWLTTERAIQAKQPVSIGPSDLVQGGYGLIYSVPVFLAEDHYWGLISVLINADHLLNFINEKTSHQRLQVAIRGRNGDGEKGEVFWGDATLFDGEGLRSTITVPGGTWQLIVKPAALDITPLYIQHLAGLLLACLVATLLFISLTASRQRRKTAEQFSKIVSQLPGMAFQFKLRPDGSSCFPFVSDGIHSLYRVNKEDLQVDASSLFKLHHPDDQVKLKAAIQKSAKELIPFSQEFRLQHQDNSLHWLFVKCSPQREEDGSTLWHGFTTDITDFKLLEDKLLANKNLLKIIIDSIPATISAFDLQNRFILTNKMAADLYGDQPEALFGKTLHEFFPKEIVDNKIRYINQVKKTEKSVTFEQELINPASGQLSTFLVSKFPIQSLDGKLYGVGAVGMDITERKQSENLLNLRNTALRTINQGVIISDAQQNILWANKAYKELTGYSLSDLKGRTCRNLLQGALTDQETIKTISITLKANDTFSGEILNYRKDGSTFWNQLAILPIFNDKGKITNFMSTSRDMTALKQAEDSLVRGKAEAEHASQVKSQFLAMMSHEIRTPLTAILGMQELLAQTPLDTVQTDYLKIATQAGTNLLAIANDILDLTKVESGKLTLEHITFDVIDLTEHCVDLVRPNALAKGLTLHTIIPLELNRWLSGDPLRYHQVLINLLSNAIKFTKTGSVTLKLTAQPATEDNRVLLVEVIDTGIGIPLASQVGLFEVFVQVDASDTRQYGGSGLGLAISKRLVDLWEGHIGVESTPAIGSRFWFTVGSGALSPALQTTTDLIKEKDAPLPFIANLLLVDDSPINQAVIIYMLRDAGHQVDVADCGKAGIAAAKNKHYDLILMDVSMPDMSGMEATKIIRQLGGAPATVPIIAITAHALAGYQDLCLAAGMNGYATKPISQKDLLAIVSNWCANKTVTDEAPVASALIEDCSVQPLVAPDKPAVILDKAILEELTTLLGQEKFNDLLNIYLIELTTRCNAIKQAIIAQDLAIISREAHTIKSTSASFGANALHAIAKDIEVFGYNDDLPMALLLVDQLLPCAEATMAAITEIYEARA